MKAWQVALAAVALWVLFVLPRKPPQTSGLGPLPPVEPGLPKFGTPEWFAMGGTTGYSWM